MSFASFMCLGIVSLITFVVTDWLTDKTIKFIKRRIEKKEERNISSSDVKE